MTGQDQDQNKDQDQAPVDPRTVTVVGKARGVIGYAGGSSRPKRGEEKD